MKVNNSVNSVQNFYLNNCNPKKKGQQAESTDSTFAGLVDSAAKATSLNADQPANNEIQQGFGNGDWLTYLTNEGKNSVGDKKLTDAQKKYLSQKYDVTDMSVSQKKSLLGELTNMGALSFNDYRLSHLRPLPPKGVMIVGVYDSSTGEIKGRVYNPTADSSSRDSLAHYRTISQQETEDYDYIYHVTGKQQANFKEFSASHGRVADLLETLVRTE